MDVGILSNVRHESPDYYIPASPARPEMIVPDLTSSSPVLSPLPSLSVIIPTYYNQAIKAGSIHAVVDGIDAAESIREVILVSTDDPAAAAALRSSLRSGSIPVRHVDCFGSQNRALARNRGAACASSEYLLLLDDDTVLKSWRLIDAMLTAVCEGLFDAALYPRRAFLKFPALFGGERRSRAIEKWRMAPSPNDDDVFDPVAQGSPYKTIRFCFPGNFMLIRMEAFRSLGGFDEAFVGWGFEDADFGLRASSNVRVLNLFRRASPLLHIDHPTTPYKSEEHKGNYARFRGRFTALDLDRFCDRVSTGRDFKGKSEVTSSARARPVSHLASVCRSFSLPGRPHRLIGREVELRQRRLEEGWEADPQWVVLHGSRAAGTSSLDSDFDLLALYHGGLIREHYVDCSGSVPVEVEFSDLGKFEDMAARPASFPIAGPLELSKLANARVLSGDASRWRAWSQEVLRSAASRGTLNWLVVALGLRLNTTKLGPVARRFALALANVLATANTQEARVASATILNSSHEDLPRLVLHLLDERTPKWMSVVEDGAPVFENQIPESWRALAYLHASRE